MKKRNIILIFLITFAFFGVVLAPGQKKSLSFIPSSVVQGEPIMIQVNGAYSDLKKMTFEGQPVMFFIYKNKPTGIVGIDLNKKPGSYEVVAEFLDGSIIKSNVIVEEKKRKKETFSIPKKLGGNTVESQNSLVVTLAEENRSLSNLPTLNKILWDSGFEPPLKEIKINDEFGYSRLTGEYSIPHKGVDYKADEGTEVMAVNRGMVLVVGEYRNYGKTVVIDHGLGVMSFYLHLSEVKVKEGDVVEKGQIIALSGQTGYASGPHLHLSIRVYGVSIDPVKFLELFK